MSILTAVVKNAHACSHGRCPQVLLLPNCAAATCATMFNCPPPLLMLVSTQYPSRGKLQIVASERQSGKSATKRKSGSGLPPIDGGVSAIAWQFLQQHTPNVHCSPHISRHWFAPYTCQCLIPACSQGLGLGGSPGCRSCCLPYCRTCKPYSL